jgi:hypothetical protein
LFSGSSVWTGISSWIALLGDLGLMGLGLYLWMSWTLWRHLQPIHRHWQTTAAKSVLLMTGLLGLIYSWLEEPAFTLLAALVVGLGLTVAGGSPCRCWKTSATRAIVPPVTMRPRTNRHSGHRESSCVPHERFGSIAGGPRRLPARR